MGFLDNIVNGVKGFMANRNANPQVLANGAPITQINPTMYGSVAQTNNQTVQNQPMANVNQSGIVKNAINNNINGVQQPDNAIISAIKNPQQEPQQTGVNANRIVNAIRNSQLRPSNWNSGTRETISNILFGIGKNALANPNGDVLSNVLGGVNSGIQNQIAYKTAINSMQQNGIDTTGLSPYADYSNMTPEKIIQLGLNNQKQQLTRDIANAKDNRDKAKLILDGYNKGYMDANTAVANLKMLGINDISELQESNETRKTNSQIDLNDTRQEQMKARTEKIKKETEQVGKPKVNISIRKGGTHSTVDIKHNGSGGNGGGKKEPKLLY